MYIYIHRCVCGILLSYTDRDRLALYDVVGSQLATSSKITKENLRRSHPMFHLLIFFSPRLFVYLRF